MSADFTEPSLVDVERDASLVGRKAAVYSLKLPVTIVRHYVEQSFVFGPVEYIEFRFDLPEDRQTYSEDTRLDRWEIDLSGQCRIRGRKWYALITLGEWIDACAAAALRRGKDEPSPEIAARGHILGRAAQLWAWRIEASRAPKPIPDGTVVEAAVQRGAIALAGDDPQALGRAYAGERLPGRVFRKTREERAVREAIGSFSGLVAETRTAMEAAERERLAFLASRAETSWVIGPVWS